MIDIHTDTYYTGTFVNVFFPWFLCASVHLCEWHLPVDLLLCPIVVENYILWMDCGYCGYYMAGDCNDELLTGNIDVGRNMPIELALFGVWTIHFWSHYHRLLTSDCRRKNELRPSSNWEKKRRNKIWIRPRHFSVDFNFYIAAQQFFFSFSFLSFDLVLSSLLDTEKCRGWGGQRMKDESTILLIVSLLRLCCG